MRTVVVAHCVLRALMLGLVFLLICGSLTGFSDAEDEPGPVLIPSSGLFGPLQSTIFWQIPEGPVRKVLILFGPVEILLTDFWDFSPSCPVCRGLPEKRKLVKDALARNYAVVLPHSVVSNNDWDRWPVDNSDLVNVLTVVAEWRSLHKMENLPMVAMGISAGNFMLATLGLYPGLFKSVAMIVGCGVKEAWDAVTEQYPPTIFVHMPKNSDGAFKIQYARRQLNKVGVPNREEKWYEHAVTPEWFSEIIPLINETLSATIQLKLIEEGWVDPETKLFTSDQFIEPWYDVVNGWNIFPDDFMGRALVTSLLDEANVAFANHTTLARNDAAAFDWLDGGYNSLRGAATS